ncbi:MAG: 50S ribosomal protein L13 [Helicobacteraceae bacterium]|jgi:large subunit ribosomal protein L13|nr:50S ribosomal protein L13 [Helicobacteraceae bacterium]
MSKLTESLNAATVRREWLLIDAADKPFGRLIGEIAVKLRGKHKPGFTPHADCGDFVVVINASKVRFSTETKQQKEYRRHTGFTGHVKSEKSGELLAKNPEKLFRLAARGMLPKNHLGREMLKKLKVYASNEHPHTAQIKANQ